MYSFCSQPNCDDGWQPLAGLVQGTDGNFYGTASLGGPYCSPYGCGTVFKVTPAGALTTLHSFNGADGVGPLAPLLQASDGSFYGTTESGGTHWGGTVFRITASGTLNTVYNFCSQPNCADGQVPDAGLVQAGDGNFYGTTDAGGGSQNCYGGCGTVFKLTASGALTTLHSFDGNDGGRPVAGLALGRDGNLYGVTAGGGAYASGTVFKITFPGELTTMHSFCAQSGCPDGKGPAATLVQGSDGNLYGTTNFGGTSQSCSYPEEGCGTVFNITLQGALTTLHSFVGTDGSEPWGGLVQAPDGFFYGTTEAGGAHGVGTVFRVGVVRPCSKCRTGGGGER